MRQQCFHYFLLGMSLAAAACSDTAPENDSETRGAIGAATDIPCEVSGQCDDGAFCNGAEICKDGFCHEGVPPSCDDNIECTTDTCSHLSNSCSYQAPDLDGDGFQDAACLGPAGEPLGRDCDDSDPDRYPGNTERCSIAEPDHDEDCDPDTVGWLDEDLDGYSSSICCNSNAEGDAICADDCDDSAHNRYPDHPEICDDVDNDCDGQVDVNTKEVLWYPDTDGDHYGEFGEEGVLSCAPIADHALRATDCNDGTASVHAAAREVCDGYDNDCDGEVDEDGVCYCSPDGNAQACACSPTRNGVQLCSGGLWQTCDCRECVDGTVDCISDLLPRVCENGQWTVKKSCSGLHPICLEGSCVCADGTLDCKLPKDVFPPQLTDSAPEDYGFTFADEGISLLFSEPIDPMTLASGLSLQDISGNVIPGRVDTDGAMAEFTPHTALSPGMLYILHIAPSVTDMAGNELAVAQPIRFQTNPTVEPQLLSSDATVKLEQAKIAVVDDNNGIIVAKKTTNNVVDGFADFSLTSGAWQEHTLPITDGDNGDIGLVEVAIDDQGRADVVQKANQLVRRFQLNNGTWTAPVTLSSDDATSNSTPPALAIHANGLGVIAAISEGDHNAWTRKSSAAYDAPVTVATQSSGLARKAVVNAAGDVAFAYLADSNIQAWLGLGAPRSWSTRILNAGTSGPISVDLAIDSDASTLYAWSQPLSQSVTQRNQVVLQEIDASGNLSGSEVFAGGSWMNRQETEARVVYAAMDSAVLTYIVEGNQLYSMHTTSPGVWSDEEEVSVLSAALSQPQLLAAANGEVVALWMHRNLTYSLWGARFIPGSGWQQAQILESTNLAVSEFDAAIDQTGTAYIVFKAGEMYTTTF